MSERVAVFVDGENISADHGAVIRGIAARHGAVDVLRVYGNACILHIWQGVAGYRMMHSGIGKNATDLLLTIEAMELALSGEFATVVIASSDRDFTHLACRLRERGLQVIGVGEVKAAEMFRAACSRFEVVGADLPGLRVVPKAAVGAAVSDLDLNIQTVIKTHSLGSQGIPITKLNGFMQKQYGVRISTLPGGSWRNYLATRQTLYDIDPKGPDAKVRFRPNGFASTG